MFDRYAEYEYVLASSQLLFAMFGMGALLGPADFVVVFRRPRELLVGLGLQWVVVPALAVALVGLLDLPPGIAAGLALVASVPGGTMSNVFTYIARGNIALSISLTAVTTVASLATTPLLLRLLAGTHLPADFSMPVGRIAFEIGAVLLAPLMAGMLLGVLLPARRERLSRWSIRVSFVCIALMVVGGAGAGRLDGTAYGWIGPAAVVLLCASFQVLAWLTTRLARLRAPERVAISIEVTVRNANLAVMVKASLFPAVSGVVDPIGDGMFFVALLYGGVALPLCMIPIVLGRRAARRAASGPG
jgi:BASS family bile acid:Na+ symporter